MRIRPKHMLRAGRFLAVSIVITTMVFGDLSWLPEPLRDVLAPKKAEAFVVDIDDNVGATGSDNINAGPTVVFTSDTTGYRFYKDSGNTCVYSKTTNRGETWGAAVTVDSQTDCINISVWYDKWTPGATGTAGTRIHIATIDTSLDIIHYNVLDTSNDTLGTTTANPAETAAAQVPTFTTGQNAVSITMATSGVLFASVDDTSDSYVLRCTSNCVNTAGWSEAGTRPQDLANDFSTLVPLMNGNVMIINRDVSADDIRSKIWSATSSAWTTTWVTIDANATEQTAAIYDVALSAVLSSTTGRVNLAYIADQATMGNNTQDIRTATFENNVWTARTAVVTNYNRGIGNVALGTDQNDGSVYVAYTGTSSNSYYTQNIFYKYSSSTMQTWSSEAGPLLASSTDIFGLSFNGTSNQRLFLTWFDDPVNDISGDTIFDTAPGIRVGTTTSQIASARATSTSLWIGSAFALKENVRTRDVTSVTLTETGTVDAQNALDNIKLYFENDTTYPYDCNSSTYNGSETLFAQPDTDGFSGPNGTVTFSTTTSISVGTTSALCLYPVMDILNGAIDLSTIDIEISSPTTDISVTLGAEILPTTTVAMTGSTTVFNDDVTLTHFHWRNDDGSEPAATSATGGVEDTNYNAYPAVTRKRLRIEVSNEGSTTTLPQQYRLEYAPKTFICAQETGWVDVAAVGGDWDMSDSTNLTNGNNTSNVGLSSNGAVTDSNTAFLGTNGGQRDTTSQTGLLTLATTSFVELEYSIIPSAGATAGNAYCFRVTDAGAPLDIYDTYPQATIASDFLLTASSTQVETIDAGQSNAYLGGQFVLQKQTVSSADVQSFTITASGSIDYVNDIDNIELWYDLDTSSPYNCASEAYNGDELQYGSTDTDGFSVSGTSTFTETISLSQTQTLCLYTVLDISATTSNGELLDIQVVDPDLDIVRSGGSMGPTNTLRIVGITEIVKAIPTQIHYHFRNNNGSEITASSASSGAEDTPLTKFEKGTSTRLRIEISNEGGTSTPTLQYRLEYAQKTAGTCGAVASGWTDVGAAGGDWDMNNIANLTDGANTTNVTSLLNGAVTDENTNFLASNAAVKDTSSTVAGMILSSTTFVELEYSIVSSSTLAADNGTYCFRVTDAGTPLESYAVYPQVTLKNVRDFKVQRGVSAIGAGVGTLTITAGVDYVAPAASTSAFIRLTNTQNTGAGATTSVATQNADDSTVYITNPWNIRNSITFQRQTVAPANSTRFAWEIVEYVGPSGGDNEFVVRQQQVMTYGTASTSASGTPVTGVTDHNDIAVFVTGVWNPDTVATNYDSMLTTATWSSSTLRAGFNRGTTGTDAVRVSYAVLEFTGANWKVQRVEHAYTATGTVETESIAALNSLTRAFIHTQKRLLSASGTHANFGHEVWLSSVGAVSFMLNGSSTAPTNHRSVAWVIENTQTKGSPMIVTRSNGTQSGGAQPLASSTDIGTTIDDVTESSIFANNSSSGTGTTFPEPMMLFELIATSTTQYRLWVSNTTDRRSYRVEVVEWPSARREITQNDYQLYVNEDALDPTDPWPVGATNLGENTAMTGLDQPTSDGSVVRIRMTLNMSGQSSMPPGIDAFKLQYGKRTGASCSAITEWQDLGDASSTTAKWRAFDNPSVDDGTLLSENPPTVGDLNISVSDRAGTYEESNNTPATSYIVRPGEDIEFDWAVENNNADEKSSYCFRMVESDGTELDAYNSTYPTVRTVGYGAESMNWRWYDDATTETPVTALAGETVTPINVTFNNSVALRITLRESNGATGSNAKFKLQFSESPTFTSATDVVATSSCGELSYWCYATGSSPENTVITTKVLSDSDACAGGVGRGCGTHTASSTAPSTFSHQATSSTEFSFTIRHAGARANRTYYFRAYDVTNDEAIVTAVGESYPSLTTEGATLTLTASSIATSTVIDGVATDVATTPTSIPFGSFTGSTTKNAGYRFTVSTDATEGYQLFVFARQGLLSNKGHEIAPITASNTTPAGWSIACSTSVTGCFGYHPSDDTLAGGSTRFSPNDSFAALETAPREIAQSSIPVTSDQVDVLYRVTTRGLQEAGQYTSSLVYIVVPIF